MIDRDAPESSKENSLTRYERNGYNVETLSIAQAQPLR